jgi:membrane protein
MELFGGQGWKVFFHKLYEKITNTDVMSRAAQIAFYFSFAFFPLLFFLITLFGLVLNQTDSLQDELYRYLGQIMPGSAFSLVQKTLAEIVEASSGGKLTFGLFITLWSASAGIDSVRGTLNSVYELRETRSWWYTKIQSLILTLGFIILIAVALAGVTAGWTLVKLGFGSLGYEVTSPWVLVSVQWAALLLVMLLATAIVYSWVPCFDKFRWVWISPGAVVAILLWIIFSGAFRTYLHFFNSYNKAYGSLGAVIILMLWMYLTGLAILLGGAINSTMTEMSEGRIDAEEKK